MPQKKRRRERRTHSPTKVFYFSVAVKHRFPKMATLLCKQRKQLRRTNTLFMKSRYTADLARTHISHSAMGAIDDPGRLAVEEARSYGTVVGPGGIDEITLRESAMIESEVSGDMRVRRRATCDENFESLQLMIQVIIDFTGEQLSVVQQQFIRFFLASTIETIYGEEAPFNADRRLRELGLDELWRFVSIITGRRNGKTFSVIIFITAALLTQEGKRILLCGPVASTTTNILDEVRDRLSLLVDTSEHAKGYTFVHDTRKEVHIKHSSWSKPCTISAASGNSTIRSCF